jgi:[lysine-biosynthesis-protein LysW]--L-2-aminoadipate ligase
MDMRLGLLYDKIGAEDIGIALAADRMGIDLEAVNARTLLFPHDFNGSHDVYIDRCKSANRRMKMAELLEGRSIPIFQTSTVERNCNDKSLTTILFMKRGLPIPKTCYVPYNTFLDERGNPVFRREELLEVAKKIGGNLSFPIVAKPVMGSWGRRVRRIRGEEDLMDALKSNVMTIENSIGIYVQEFVRKPFDLRSHVMIKDGDAQYITTIARVSPSDQNFITNTAQGGLPLGLDAPLRVQDLCLRMAEAVAQDQGSALLALDILPVVEDLEEREAVYMLHRETYGRFRTVWRMRERYFRNVALTKERVAAAEKPLKEAFEDFMSQESYLELKKLTESLLKRAPLLANEANSNPDFWFNVRNTTGIDLSSYYLDCAESLVGH